jgi:hypothetical protein
MPPPYLHPYSSALCDHSCGINDHFGFALLPIDKNKIAGLLADRFAHRIVWRLPQFAFRERPTGVLKHRVMLGFHTRLSGKSLQPIEIKDIL